MLRVAYFYMTSRETNFSISSGELVHPMSHVATVYAPLMGDIIGCQSPVSEEKSLCEYLPYMEEWVCVSVSLYACLCVCRISTYIFFLSSFLQVMCV